MAKIYTQSLFSWKEIDDLGDLERLKVILDTMPDEKLMRVLEKQRGYGRDDYPIRATWNSVLSGIVFQHKSIESMQRELLQNAQLRELCGFDPLKGVLRVAKQLCRNTIEGRGCCSYELSI